MKKSYLTLLILTFLLVSCDKFEDGGYLYQSSKNVRGTWDYEQVTVNGQELSDSAFYARYRNSYIVFDEGSQVHFFWHDVDTAINEQIGTYVFNYNKKKMNIVFDAYPLDDQVWQMDKLTKEELWYTFQASEDETWHVHLLKRKKEK